MKSATVGVGYWQVSITWFTASVSLSLQKLLSIILDARISKNPSGRVGKAALIFVMFTAATSFVKTPAYTLIESLYCSLIKGEVFVDNPCEVFSRSWPVAVFIKDFIFSISQNFIDLVKFACNH